MTRKRIDYNWQIVVRIITTKNLYIVINKAIMVKEMMIRVMVMMMMISYSGSNDDDDSN